jgi:hypothetical protein
VSIAFDGDIRIWIDALSGSRVEEGAFSDYCSVFLIRLPGSSEWWIAQTGLAPVNIR